MKVSELKKVLQTVADDLEVVIELPDKIECGYGGHLDSFSRVASAHFAPKSAISNSEFMIVAGVTFDY